MGFNVFIFLLNYSNPSLNERELCPPLYNRVKRVKSFLKNEVPQKKKKKKVYIDLPDNFTRDAISFQVYLFLSVIAFGRLGYHEKMFVVTISSKVHQLRGKKIFLNFCTVN